MNKRNLTLFLVLLAPLSLLADNSKISPDLQNSSSTSQEKVVVQYAPGTQLSCSGLLGLPVRSSKRPIQPVRRLMSSWPTSQ